MSTKKRLPAHTKGSGNIFADLGLPNAEERQLNAELAVQLKRSTMTRAHRLFVGDASTPIALARWGEPDSDKPPALLLHGTGFVAEVWTEVAEALAADYTVYALDRRGHGLSHKPSADRYHFQDFAEDLSRRWPRAPQR